jgi:hypothetical protein
MSRQNIGESKRIKEVMTRRNTDRKNESFFLQPRA